MKTGALLSSFLSLKNLFLSFCLLPFALCLTLCLTAGISGDEPVHRDQAVNVHRYFATGGKDLSAIDTPLTFLKYYGQSVDNISEFINRALHLQRPYLTRHLVSAFCGALAMLFAGLLAFEIAGYGAGILTILFLLLSPVFLGHTYNNLKDIPFALGYVSSIYFLVRFLKRLPVIHYGFLAGMAAGAGFAISVRIGGLVILPIIGLFTAIGAWTSRPEGRGAMLRYFGKLAVLLIIAALIACFAGIVNWPYGWQAPVKHSLESLGKMTHYIVSIRQLFEGKLWWSENLPLHYAPKYFLIVMPLVILTGIPLSWPLRRKLSANVFATVVFSAVFPLFWVVAVHANLYGNIRHLLFIYPLLAVLSACGWVLLIRRFKTGLFRYAVAGMLAAGLMGPLLHIIRNHPVEYVYFNRLAGGVKGAYHRYETDYWFNSLGPAARWLEKNVLSKPGGDTLTIASNFPLEPFFAESFPRVRTVYTPWFERGQQDWDYGLFVNAYLGPGGLAEKQLSPGQVIHSVTVDGMPMCHIMRRINRDDLKGFRLFSAGDYSGAAVLLDGAVRKEPGNETAWLYLGWSRRQMKDFNASDRAGAELVRIWPESEPAMELLIWNRLSTGRFNEAAEMAGRLHAMNPKYGPAENLMAAARDSIASGKQ